jgi:hypothetical protein
MVMFWGNNLGNVPRAKLVVEMENTEACGKKEKYDDQNESYPDDQSEHKN